MNPINTKSLSKMKLRTEVTININQHNTNTITVSLWQQLLTCLNAKFVFSLTLVWWADMLWTCLTSNGSHLISWTIYFRKGKPAFYIAWTVLVYNITFTYQLHNNVLAIHVRQIHLTAGKLATEMFCIFRIPKTNEAWHAKSEYIFEIPTWNTFRH